MPEHLGPYLKFLNRMTIVWVTGNEYGLVLKLNQVGINLYKHDPGDVEELADTVTHEIVHRLNPSLDGNEPAVIALTRSLMGRAWWRAAVFKCIGAAFHETLHDLRKRKKTEVE